MTGYHTRWVRLEETADDPERIAGREALAFSKALHDIRAELGLSVAELAAQAAMTEDDIERIEEGGIEPTVPLLRRLAAALNATVHLTPGTTWARSPSKPSPPELTRQTGNSRLQTRPGAVVMIGSRAAEMPGSSRAELVNLSVHLAVCERPLVPMSGRPLVA
jgi:transcriptional regulator with XRE-family HTH domain